MGIKTRKILDFGPMPALFLGKGHYACPIPRDAVDHVVGTPFEVDFGGQVQTFISVTVIKVFLHPGDLGWPSSAFDKRQNPIVRTGNLQVTTSQLNRDLRKPWKIISGPM
jgi:hypothetical protein